MWFWEPSREGCKVYQLHRRRAPDHTGTTSPSPRMQMKFRPQEKWRQRSQQLAATLHSFSVWVHDNSLVNWIINLPVIPGEKVLRCSVRVSPTYGTVYRLILIEARRARGHQIDPTSHPSAPHPDLKKKINHINRYHIMKTSVALSPSNSALPTTGERRYPRLGYFCWKYSIHFLSHCSCTDQHYTGHTSF